MNCRQLCQKIQTQLRAAVWASTSNKVFAAQSVIVSVSPQVEAIKQQVMPIAIIAPLDAQADPQYSEAPGLISQRIAVTLLTCIPNDRFGEAPLVGANPTGTNTSAGRGLLEIEERMFNAILLLTAQDSVNIQFSHAGSAAPLIDAQTGYIVGRDYYFTALITSTTS